ncbi:hypothetical protein Ancab_027489 [Ancistrocladus abbreviatus]
MVSDTELVDRLYEILRTSDLNITTPGSVRRQLELDFGLDLSHRKPFISQQIDHFLHSFNNHTTTTTSNRQEEEEEEEEEEEDDDRKEQAVEEEDDDDDNDGTDPKGSKKQRPDTEDKVRKRRGGGFTKLCSLSPQLQEFVGVPVLARTEVVRKLWAYIREKELQDPQNKRNIKCDKKLHAIFHVDSINMFQMNKALSKHIWPLEAEDEPSANSALKEKEHKRRKEEDADKPKVKSKRQKGGTSGFLAPLQLSDALVKFLGTGETALSRADVVKRIWEYIKQNNLQDPADKRRIMCDDKLKELFDVDTFQGFSVTKLLTAHLIKNQR